MRTSRSPIAAVALLVSLAAIPRAAVAEPYRIVVIPDTQFAAEKWPEFLDSMGSWIAANAERLDIEFVLHVGDIVQNGHVEEEWRRFDACARMMENTGVPYVLAAGNHDFDMIEGERSLVLFNRFFPARRFSRRPSFGGSYPQWKNDSSYHAFRAGGTNWLVVSLIFEPTEDVVAWADRVIAAHPQHQVIVLTHYYLDPEGRGEPGKRLWETLVKRHANILFVICGHKSTVHYSGTGDHGNTVLEMCFDWQRSTDRERNSYLGIMEIDPERRTLSVTTYSPYLDRFREEPQDRFTIENLELMRRKPAHTVPRRARF